MVATLLSTLVLGAQSGVTIKFQPPLNRPYRYQMVMNMVQTIPGMGPMNMKTVMDMVMTAVARRGSQTTVESKVTKAQVTLPPNSPMAGMKSQMEKQMMAGPAKMVMGTDFKIVSGGAAGSSVQGFAGMNTLNVPNHPLRVGDTWSSNLDLGKISGKATRGVQMSGKIPMKFKLVSLRGKVAQISTSMVGSTNLKAGGMNMKMTMNGKGMTLLDTSTGMTESMNMSTDTTTNMGTQSFKQRMTMSMRRK